MHGERPAIEVPQSPRLATCSRDSRRARLTCLILAAIFLGACHVLLEYLWPSLVMVGPDEPPAVLKRTVSLGLFLTNLFVLAIAIAPGTLATVRQAAACVGGYVVLVCLQWPLVRVLPENLLLLALSVMMYGSLLRRPWLLDTPPAFILSQDQTL